MDSLSVSYQPKKLSFMWPLLIVVTSIFVIWAGWSEYTNNPDNIFQISRGTKTIVVGAIIAMVGVGYFIFNFSSFAKFPRLTLSDQEIKIEKSSKILNVIKWSDLAPFEIDPYLKTKTVRSRYLGPSIPNVIYHNDIVYIPDVAINKDRLLEELNKRRQKSLQQIAS